VTDLEPFDLRSIPVILADMEAIADACAGTPSDDDLGPLFERALSDMLEIRVSRMPEDPDELRRMVLEAERGPGVPLDEAFERAHAHSEAFRRDLEAYRASLADRDWDAAAAMLADARPGGGWLGDARVTLDLGESRLPAAAMLASVMRMHGARPETWRR
jgi:hypothetical protein